MTDPLFDPRFSYTRGESQPAVVSGIVLPTDLFRHLDDIERDIVTAALVQHNLNRTKAGQAIGLTLRQMRYAMAKLGIEIDVPKLVTPEGRIASQGRRFAAPDSHSAEEKAGFEG